MTNKAGQRTERWYYVENERSAGGKWYTVCRVDGEGPVMPAMINEDGAQHWVNHLNTLESQLEELQQRCAGLEQKAALADEAMHYCEYARPLFLCLKRFRAI